MNASKIAVPRLDGVSLRDRLFGLLDRARERPIVWLGAPAGAGKSTLVASYVAARGLRCIWYEVDGRDRDPVNLFYYLGQALEAEVSGASEPLPVLTGDDPDYALGFVRRYFDALFARLSPPALLVFDDCHLVSESDRWFEFVRTGLEAIPPGFNVLLLSRSSPVPSLARLVAGSQVALLGWDDIRFSREESIEMIRGRAEKLGIPFTNEDAARLHEESGGWAAALVLALECARVEAVPPSFRAPGSKLQIFNYFLTELFAYLEPEPRKLLIRSAHLPSMTGPMLDRLFGVTGSQRWLESLRRDNPFLQALDASPPAYRYHPLFRDFLVSRAEQELDTEERRRLRRGAAAILAEQRELDQALSLLDPQEDAELAASLLISGAPLLAIQGRGATIRDWAARLPAEAIENKPWLGFWYAMASLGSRPCEAADLFRGAMQRFRHEGDTAGYWSAWCGVAQAILLCGQNVRDMGGLCDWAASGDPPLPFPSPEVEAKVVRSLALVLATASLGSPESHLWIERAFSLPPGRDPTELVIATMCFGLSGDVGRFSTVLEPWRRRAKREDIGTIAKLTLAMAETLLALECAEFTQCQDTARSGFELAERSGSFIVNSTLQVHTSYAYIASGDVPALRLILDDLAQAVADHGRPLDWANFHFVASRLAVLEQDGPRALRHAEEGLRHAQRLAWVAECFHRVALAEAQWRAGRADDALVQIDIVCKAAAGIVHIAHQGALLLQSAILREQGNAAGAAEALEAGFALGARYEFMPIVAPARDALALLCAEALKRSRFADYAGRVADKFAFTVAERSGPDTVPLPPAPSARSAPADFSKAVRSALRGLQQTRKLLDSPLLDSRVVTERAGHGASAHARVQVLQEIIRELIAGFAKSSRSAPMHRALVHTYLDPLPSQLLAAEAAHMSFGTYRRHLAAATDEIVTLLWLREQAAAGAS